MKNIDTDQMLAASASAFEIYQSTSFQKRADFLDAIADAITALGDSLINQAHDETNLPVARLVGERARTIHQLRMFAELLREGSFVEASIDTAIPDKNPPRPDIRKMLFPLGPVVVFGASNFPFAYSTAGGDTASALAAGCTVIVKGHPAHLKTSEMVAKAIGQAIAQHKLPEAVFQHVSDTSFETGKQLVQHKLTTAVGFTGSHSGGMALFQYAATRPEPIPVFAEMGSVNPVLILPDALSKQSALIAKQYAASISLGMGQFCTNPGILITVDGEGLPEFINALKEAFKAVEPMPMLHAGIHKAYQEKLQAALTINGVETITKIEGSSKPLTPDPVIATVSAKDFISNPMLAEEVFGPYSILIRAENMDELKAAWISLKGQLTTSLMGTDADFEAYPWLQDTARSIAGRIVYNGVPTGVEVCNSMFHGGPSPATTDARFTAVGIDGIKRWMRPVCFQQCPDYLLPDALKEANPLKILRRKNGKME